MSEKRQVIASGITNLTDARYFAAMGVDWMGFDLRTEPRIPVEQMHAIMDWVEGPRWFVEIMQTPPFDMPSNVEWVISSRKINDWQEASESSPEGQDGNKPLLIDCGKELTTSEHETIETLAANNTVWIRAAWQEELLHEVFHRYPQVGIVLSGGTEEEVGVKDFEFMDVLFELLDR